MVILLSKRILVALTMVLASSTLVFVLIHLAGDPVDGFLSPGASPDVKDAARARLGFDDPLIRQWFEFMRRTLVGDFGESWRNRQPALDAVLVRLPATLFLAAAAIALSSVLGIAIGALSATLEVRWLRRLVRGVGLLGQAIPAFWLGTVLIMVFAVELRWLPPSGNDGWQSLILPALALSAYPGSLIARMTQTSLLDVRSRPYITTAQAKGLSQFVVMSRHALPNALIPTLAMIGLQAGFLAGGAIVVESVFAYPGIGMLAMQAAADRDLPVVQAFVVVTIFLVSIVNMTVDTLAAILDPAQRQGNRIGHAHG